MPDLEDCEHTSEGSLEAVHVLGSHFEPSGEVSEVLRDLGQPLAGHRREDLVEGVLERREDRQKRRPAVLQPIDERVSASGLLPLGQHLVPGVLHIAEEGTDVVGQPGEEGLRLLEVAEDDLEGVCPPSADAGLEGVHHHRQGLDVLGRCEGLATDLGERIAKVPEGLQEDLGRCPTLRELLVEQGCGSAGRSGLGPGDVVSIPADLLEGSGGDGRLDQVVLPLLGGNVGEVERLVVGRRQEATREGLGQVVHGDRCGVRALTGECGHVGNTLDGRDGTLEGDACVHELRQSPSHVTEVVDGLVGVRVELLEVLVHDLHASARRVHDGLDRGQLLIVVRESVSDRSHSQ